MRRIAEEQERQRQLQMAHKLEIMRKKKQEYLQYQRQLALQRIQEQEREMQLRQEQQKAQYRMGQSSYPFIGQGSPNHQIPSTFGNYGYNVGTGTLPRFGTPNSVPQPHSQAGISPTPMPGMYTPGMAPLANQAMAPANQLQVMPSNQGSVSNANAGQMNMPSGQVVGFHPPTSVSANPAMPLPQPTMIGAQTVPTNLMQGSDFIQGQVHVAAGVGTPNNAAVNSQMQNMSQSVANSGIVPGGNQNNNAPGQPQFGESKIGESSNTNVQEYSEPGKQNSEEDGEVTTAELISFD